MEASKRWIQVGGATGRVYTEADAGDLYLIDEEETVLIRLPEIDNLPEAAICAIAEALEDAERRGLQQGRRARSLALRALLLDEEGQQETTLVAGALENEDADWEELRIGLLEDSDLEEE